MARLMLGILLIVVFVLVMVAAAVFRPGLFVKVALLAAAALLVPGVVLAVTGWRRVILFKDVGRAVLAAARQTGHVYISEIAAQTHTDPDAVARVAATLSKLGALPRDVQIS